MRRAPLRIEPKWLSQLIHKLDQREKDAVVLNPARKPPVAKPCAKLPPS